MQDAMVPTLMQARWALEDEGIKGLIGASIYTQKLDFEVR